MMKHREYVIQQTPFWEEEGKLLKYVRTTYGITQKEVSDRIGVSVQTIHKLESGKSVRCRKMMIKSYESALELTELQKSHKQLQQPEEKSNT